ncbi:MAG: LTA synthase family protein, partial [bacterium]|nr:LTA synthase family protein [bacterium]
IFIFYNIFINRKLYLNIRYTKKISKNIKKNIITIKKEVKNKKITLYPFNLFKNHKIIFTLIISIIFLLISFQNMKVFKFIKNNIVSSEFIESNYNQVDSSKIVLNEGKNLIYIYLESLETTFFTKDQGGDWDYEVIPEMYQILNDEDSICFSCNNDGTGMYAVDGANFTTGAVVGNSTGLPLKVPIDANSYHSKNFMNGAYAIGDILKDKGYYNEVISSATTSFGGLKEFFTKHGNYSIIDIDSLKNYNFNPNSNDLSGWGFNDKYLFELAKKRLKTLSKEKDKFNLTLISIDTHFPDGYKGDYTIDKYNTQYENVYATESKLVYDFITWVKKQSFYENTVIVIVGDHLSMQPNFFDKYDQTKRLVYNVIINSCNKEDSKDVRKYTAFDMLPTTLSAMGAKIFNDQIGLGVNLFSNKKTLTEEYGINKLNENINLKSDFYNNKILGDDYKEMIKEEGKE